MKELKATKVPASEYPTLKDFVGYIEGQLVLAKTAEMERSYRRILSTFVKLLNTNLMYLKEQRTLRTYLKNI